MGHMTLARECRISIISIQVKVLFSFEVVLQKKLYLTLIDYIQSMVAIYHMIGI